MTTPPGLLARELSRDGSRPFLTYYDDASGERIELSVATTANWVAKIANFLTDEHDVGAGDLVTVRLPLHWQAAVILLGCWSAGAQVGTEAGDAGAVVGFATTDADTTIETIVVSLAPMGADFARLVASQPDDFVGFEPSGADLVATADLDLPTGSRVLTVRPLDGPEAISCGLLAPLAAGGSVVMIRNADPGRLANHAETERVTHTVGIQIATLPRLDR